MSHAIHMSAGSNIDESLMDGGCHRADPPTCNQVVFVAEPRHCSATAVRAMIELIGDHRARVTVVVVMPPPSLLLFLGASVPTGVQLAAEREQRVASACECARRAASLFPPDVAVSHLVANSWRQALAVAPVGQSHIVIGGRPSRRSGRLLRTWARDCHYSTVATADSGPVDLKRRSEPWLLRAVRSGLRARYSVRRST
jgi:hypothetical protein